MGILQWTNECNAWQHSMAWIFFNLFYDSSTLKYQKTCNIFGSHFMRQRKPTRKKESKKEKPNEEWEQPSHAMAFAVTLLSISWAFCSLFEFNSHLLYFILKKSLSFCRKIRMIISTLTARQIQSHKLLWTQQMMIKK